MGGTLSCDLNRFVTALKLAEITIVTYYRFSSSSSNEHHFELGGMQQRYVCERSCDQLIDWL